MLHNRKKIVVFIPIAILLVVPYIIMLLWNNMLTDIISVHAITYMQAIGLFVLCRLLFGRYGFNNGNKPPFSKPFMKERMMHLSEEEKCKMKEEWEKRFQSNEDTVK